MSQLTIEKKCIAPLTLLAATITTTLNTLVQNIGNIPCEIMEEIEAKGLVASGPAVFEYVGCTDDLEKEFTLYICFPVAADSTYEGTYDLVTTKPFDCLETNYTGSMQDLGPKGWMPFMGAIMQDGASVTDVCREVYTNWAGPESDENVIELQMGIK
ncbi:MAG: GyrI-like domain-containing protein [Fibrobacterales bacterium]